MTDDERREFIKIILKINPQLLSREAVKSTLNKNPQPFTDDAIKNIFDNTKGSPREICKTGEISLVFARLKHTKIIDRDITQAAYENVKTQVKKQENEENLNIK